MSSNKIERVESRFALTWPLILRCLRSGAGILRTLTMQNFKQFCTGSASKSILAEDRDQKLKASLKIHAFKEFLTCVCGFICLYMSLYGFIYPDAY